jgi:hypothetical protein
VQCTLGWQCTVAEDLIPVPHYQAVRDHSHFVSFPKSHTLSEPGDNAPGLVSLPPLDLQQHSLLNSLSSIIPSMISVALHRKEIEKAKHNQLSATASSAQQRSMAYFDAGFVSACHCPERDDEYGVVRPKAIAGSFNSYCSELLKTCSNVIRLFPEPIWDVRTF